MKPEKYLYEPDIIIAGAVSGVAAALAARRLGSKVLLIEKSVMLGGLATLGLKLVRTLMSGRHIIKGISETLLLSIQYVDSTCSLENEKKGDSKLRRYATPYSHYLRPYPNDRMSKEGIDGAGYDYYISYGAKQMQD